MPDKDELRRILLQTRRAVMPSLRASWDKAISARIGDWCKARPCATLGVYWPIRGEPDLHLLYAELTTAGIALALPVVVGREQPLRFAAWTPGDAMVNDGYGISIPAAQDFSIVPDALLIPCVGFNRARYRLGYGGGFYDRTLAALPRPATIGVAYANAEAEFEGAAHDIALDAIV
ncbi:MAG: 5-formyltetrahydrofolate cyclo-ligase, partial [Herminiimonas sp.]|nr:5-formyltetrahydrofolate cyclo-ligase [Herminiimonas sp.]